jgi:hypothetical protein
VAENEGAFTAPLTVLATAAAQVDRVWVDLLTKHPAVEPVETDWTRWASLSATLGLVGRLDAAEALLVALDCDILTAEPGLHLAWVMTRRSSRSEFVGVESPRFGDLARYRTSWN